MIKRIRADQVQVGMFIHRLDRDWMDHSFFSSHFLVSDAAVIARLATEGIVHVFIDTKKGLDLSPEPAAGSGEEPVAAPPPVSATEQPPGTSPPKTQTKPRIRVPQPSWKRTDLLVPFAEERVAARTIYSETTGAVRDMMNDVRLGRGLDVAALEPLTAKMIASVFRNPHALCSVARIKNKDEYTYMHCVAVSAIMAAFARYLELPEGEIQEVVRGALLHDVGKILVPDAVLNKPGPLTDEEFVIMRGHAALGIEALQAATGFSDRSMEPVAMHHERNDGSGYPHGLKGEQISLIGQMSAIVDVYDALTSLRVYKESWEPSLALKHMLESSPAKFETHLVQRFIRFLGIYPVGSLVQLESGQVAIVLDQVDDLLRPRVLVVYNSKRRHYVSPRLVELEQRTEDRILRVVSPRDYGIDVTNFI